MNKKALAAGGILGLAFLFASKAKAGGRVDPPTGPTDGPTDGPTEPPTDGPTEPPEEPPPVIPQGQASNYVGSGWSWSGALRQAFPAPVSIGTAMVALGYPISFVPGDTPHTIPFNMISTPNMTAVREFQRDYNAGVIAQTVDDNPTPNTLDDDGLVGKNTMRALLNAKRWADELGVSWGDIVALA